MKLLSKIVLLFSFLFLQGCVSLKKHDPQINAYVHPVSIGHYIPKEMLCLIQHDFRVKTGINIIWIDPIYTNDFNFCLVHSNVSIEDDVLKSIKKNYDGYPMFSFTFFIYDVDNPLSLIFSLQGMTDDDRRCVTVKYHILYLLGDSTGIHELGHLFGLDHTYNPINIMFPVMAVPYLNNFEGFSQKQIDVMKKFVHNKKWDVEPHEKLQKR